jgi:uncharacterized RDD family membrane protein YckC
MKCPKCGYLGFEAVDRCRNCGYDFALTSRVTIPELPLRQAAGPDRLEDFPLVATAPRATELPAVAPSSELPLFGAPPSPPPSSDDEPLITRASAPRAPLAVRRATPDLPRGRAVPARTPMLDLATDVDDRSASSAALAGPRSVPRVHQPASETAGLLSRVVAAAIDVTVLLGIDALVLYFTIQICGLTMADASALPKGPLAFFLLLQNGAYLVAFTAGGQTLGKMALGIKVVAAEDSQPPDVGRALRRSMWWLVLTAPAGLGLLSTLLSPDRRGFHDRAAGTRVVRATVG